MTQNKMVQPSVGRYQEHRKDLERNQKGKIVGRGKRLETYCPSVHMKQ
jgi:hypothetical protein